MIKKTKRKGLIQKNHRFVSIVPVFLFWNKTRCKDKCRLEYNPAVQKGRINDPAFCVFFCTTELDDCLILLKVNQVFGMENMDITNFNTINILQL